MNGLFFKVLGDGGWPFHGGADVWSLPHDGEPGDWMPPIQDVALCKRGYHLCRSTDLIQWLGPRIYVAEYRGQRVDGEDKIVVSEARLLRHIEGWGERTARLFACDCAERVLPIFEREHVDDDRPRCAIETARRFADGEVTREQLAAARDAAWATAEDAARDAAEDTAWDAARAAAWAAERQWQTTRLMEYLEVTA